MSDAVYDVEINHNGNDCEVSAQNETINNSSVSNDTKSVANWFVMTGALTRKNFLMLWSAKIQLLLIISIPIICFILGVLSENAISDSFTSLNNSYRIDQNFQFESSQVPLWKKCKWKNVYKLPSDDCFTIMYAYDHSSTNSSLSESESLDLVDSIMETLAKSNDLTIETMSSWAESNDAADVDTQIATLKDTFGTADIVGVSSPDILASFLAQEDGHVESSLLFQTPVNSTEISSYEYSNRHKLFDVNLLKNKTSIWDGGREGEEFYFNAIKKAAFKVQVDNKPINIKVNIQNEDWQTNDVYFGPDFDSGPSFVDGFLVMAYCIVSILLMNFIAREKQQELIGSLRLMGMHDSAYWASWFIVVLSISTFSSLAITITSYIAAYEKLSKLNFFLPFILLSVSQTVITTTTLILIPLASTQRVLNVLQFFLLIAFSASYIVAFSSNYVVSPSSTAGRVFHLFVPSTNFVRILGPILEYSTKYGVHQNLPDVYNWEVFGTSLNDCDETNVEGGNGDQLTICTWKDYHDSNPYECRRSYNDPENKSLPDYCFYSAQNHSSLLVTMIIQMFIYLVLASFLLIVIPSGNGIARRPWFFLEPSFWIRSKIKNDMSYSSVNSDPNQTRPAQERSLLIEGLSKHFKGNVVAVKDMNLEIREGEIFALLGHNGAGKTTLINILTGKLTTTSGEAYLHGLKLSKDLSAIQEMTGIVPQHDRLWSELSAYEHIRLFATLKNQGSKENIAGILKKVYLEKDQNQASGEYSGGMKRRLSIAIASVGDAKIIYMDEPTTGIDPLNRRRIWNLIQDLKVGRIIVLTTHLMQEADVLGDTVGIMDSGIMKVKGTPLNLKTTYGSGYTLSIYTSKSSDVDHVCQLANQTIEGLEVVNIASTSTSLGIPKNQVSAIPSLARQLQERGLIQDWSVSQSTLEEVFLRLAATKSDNSEARVSIQENSKNAKIEQGDIEEEAMTQTQVGEFVSSDGSQVTYQPKSISQVRALLRKQFILRKRSPVGALLQFLLPIGLALVLVSVQFSVGAPKYTKRCGSCPSSNDNGAYNDDCDMIEQCKNRTKPEFWKEFLQSENTVNNKKVWSDLWGQRFLATSSNYCDYDYSSSEEVITTVDGFNLFSGLPSASDFTVKDQEDVRQIRKFVENKTVYSATKEEEYGTIYGYGTYYYVGGFDKPTPIEEGTPCNEIIKEFKGIPRLGIDVAAFPNTEDKDVHLDISFLLPQSPLRYRYCIAKNGTCADSQPPVNLVLEPSLQRYDIANEYLEVGSYKLLSSHYNVSQVEVSRVKDVLYYYLDDVSYEPAIASEVTGYLPIFLGVSLSLTTIPTMYDLITEKHGGYIFALLLNGMKLQNYWIAQYLHHALYFVVNSVIFLAIIIISGVKTDLNWGSLILVMSLYMYGQFSFICLVSNFIKKPRLASALLMLYLFVLYFTMSLLIILSKYIGDTSFMAGIPLVLDLLPQVCFLRSVYYIATRYDQNTVLIGNMIMILSSTVYLFLGIYLHRSSDNMSLLKKSFSSAINCFRKSTLPKDQDLTERDGKKLEDDIDEIIDIDVRQEKKRARELMPSETAVKVDGLSKTFQMKGFQFKNAVVDLTMAMDSGEVFGLLGPNGAGKTTAISMITGQLNSSQGQVFVGGYNIETERIKALENLGIVPQFDRLYDDLTVQEHLEIYAQIKGVVSHQLTEWSTYIAEMVSLHTPDLFGRKSKELSGGMKRRLSIGIALLSHPKVLLLDEPTTGLDPAIKRSIWNIVESMREKKCILLTTHSMDEAEALCDRIGIMSKGSLLCVGTQNHLRSRYGDTFELSFTTSRTSVEGEEAPALSLESFLENNFSDVTRISSYGCSHVFTIARDGVDLTKLFNVVIKGQSEGLYKEWGVGQSSLDEIFIAITAESEAT